MPRLDSDRPHSIDWEIGSGAPPDTPGVRGRLGTGSVVCACMGVTAHVVYFAAAAWTLLDSYAAAGEPTQWNSYPGQLSAGL